MIRSKENQRSFPAHIDSEEDAATTPETHEMIRRLERVMQLQHEHSASLQSIADTLELVRKTLDGQSKPLLTVSEAAKLAVCSDYTIRRWIRDRKLDAERVQGTGRHGRWLIRREALLGLLAKGLGGEIPATAIGAVTTSTDE